MSRRLFWILTALYAAATGLLIGLLDRPIAAAIHAEAALHDVGAAMNWVLEWLFLMPLWKFFWGAAALATGLLLAVRRHPLARTAGLVAVTFFAARVLSGGLKLVVGRVRPEEVLGTGGAPPEFFVAGADSFPSSHAAAYFGLLLPLALSFPRWRWPVLALAVLGAGARVLLGAHYPSDVLASAYLALVLTLLFARAFRIQWPAARQ